jgi:hypothetical protein
MNENLIPNAQLYAARRRLELSEPLGSGKDGIVLMAQRKAQAGRVAVKALRWAEAYERERKVYERLRQAGVSSVHGFSVPHLVGSDEELRILEITVVDRPFVLDFAGAYLDARPEFPEEVWTDWEAEKREQFEGRWPQVQRVLDEFEGLRIFLLDVSPGNIAFPD